MFVAKFNQVSPNSEAFNTDKNGEMPFIGTVIAGKARGTIINGTIFKREGYKPQSTYLCQNNEVEYDGEKRIETQIVQEITSPIDLLKAKEMLGEPVLVQQRRAEVEDDAPIAVDDAVVNQPTTEEVV